MTAVVAVALGGSQGASAARVTNPVVPGRPTVPVADATLTVPVAPEIAPSAVAR